MDWRWFALRVSPGHELAVEARLREDDHFVFVPLRHVYFRRRPKDRAKTMAARAQFPGYCFLGQPPGFELPWLRILDRELNPDILGVIGHQGTPTPVHEPSMVPMIANRLLLASRLNGRLQAPRRRRKGRGTAEIINGPYQDRTVRVIEIADQDPELYGLFKEKAA